ncbi:CipC-like protein [Crepidotus variabilis]|uniref:CipC-like protein n=1 Tax=Crepidotus variabilis TaxID=179855 RepID=A0A9P6EKR7_9AGAR|nr:CipC-like protein [Crepidotus variabilis]
MNRQFHPTSSTLYVLNFFDNMGWFDDDSDQAAAYDEVMNAPHKSHLSHELIAAAASYEAMKGYEKHVRQNGQPASHEQAKEILAGLSGFFVDKLVETKGVIFA